MTSEVSNSLHNTSGSDLKRPAPIRVLVACEFSGVVRNAFRAAGHDAWSCDILAPEDGSPYHIQADIRDVANESRFVGGPLPCDVYVYPLWDLMIAHPPCTHLSVSGARWFKNKANEQAEALDLVRFLMECRIPKIALENPISIISSHIRKPDQIIQPWQFGHGETKATCLWLKGLPKLQPTNIVEGRKPRVHHEPPSPERWKNRSRTLPGIAEAMAEQWGAA